MGFRLTLGKVHHNRYAPPRAQPGSAIPCDRSRANAPVTIADFPFSFIMMVLSRAVH